MTTQSGNQPSWFAPLLPSCTLRPYVQPDACRSMISTISAGTKVSCAAVVAVKEEVAGRIFEDAFGGASAAGAGASACCCEVVDGVVVTAAATVAATDVCDLAAALGDGAVASAAFGLTSCVIFAFGDGAVAAAAFGDGAAAAFCGGCGVASASTVMAAAAGAGCMACTTQEGAQPV